MNNIWITTWYTIREALARKVFLFFLGLSALAIIVSAVVINVLSDTSIISGLNQKASDMILEAIAAQLQIMIVAPLTSLCILLSIFSSSSFIPVMLEKGNIDLLLSKPISRTQLLTGKFLGVLLVVMINISFLVLGVLFVISLRFSFFDFTFLSIIFTVTFTFAVLYSLIVLFGVITQGSVLGMMSAYFIFLVFSPVLYFGKVEFEKIIKTGFLKSVIEILYYIVPKTFELMGNVTMNLALGEGNLDYQPILTSLAFMFASFGYAIFIFNKKDF